MLAGVSPIFRLLRSCRESLKETTQCYPLAFMPWAQPGSHLFHFGGESSKIKVPPRGETESASVLAGVSPIFRLLRSCRESLKETTQCYPLAFMPWAQPGSHLFHFGGESSKIKVPSSRRNGIGLCVGWSLSDLSAAPLLSRKLEGNHQMLSTCPHALGTPGSHLFHFGGESSKIKVPSSRRNGIGLCVGWSLSDLSATPLLSRKLEGNHHMLSTCPHALGTTRLAPFPFWRRAPQDQGPLLEEKRNRPLCWLESLRSFGYSALVAKA